ncbi:MAG TPA: hypothetical protein PKM72_14600 [Nitrospirales bacterium]|nr:hypothetical protein [Nitrospirales bacterium]
MGAMSTHTSNTETNEKPTNKKQKKEIEDDIIGKLTHYSELMRESNSIKTSMNFHLDAKQINSDDKVEIQMKFLA